MLALIKQGFAYVMENDFKTIVYAINSKTAHPLIQFSKYALCGVLATLVHVGAFYLFAFIWFPAALDHEVASDLVRRNNAVYANLAAFPISNSLAYVTNAVWVFTGGRHDRLREFLLFTLVSGISFGAGLVGGPQLIKWFGVNTHLAQGSMVVTSALANFLLRKFVIFQN